MDVDLSVEETVTCAPSRMKRHRNMVTRSHGNSGEPLQGGNVAGTVHNTEHYGFGKQAGNSCCRGCLERDATLKSILEQNHVTTVLLTDVLQQLHELKEEKYKKVGDHHAPFLVRFPALKFPLSSDEEISLFENILNSGEEFEDGVQELHKIGGDNIYQFVKRVLTTLLTNHLAVTYSWMGRKGKKPFNKSIIANLVICAAEKAKIAANRRDTETAIQLWLKRATDRIAGTSKKF